MYQRGQVVKIVATKKELREIHFGEEAIKELLEQPYVVFDDYAHMENPRVRDREVSCDVIHCRVVHFRSRRSVGTHYFLPNMIEPVNGNKEKIKKLKEEGRLA